VTVSLASVFGHARRPVIGARRWDAVLRVSGLVVGTTDLRRLGTGLLVTGCLVPPRATAEHRSPA
jgi:hypothetical protein